MSAGYAAPRFLDAGDSGLVVEFGAEVSREINERVLTLAAALERAALRGVVELVPTYRSLMIHYDMMAIGRDALTEAVAQLLDAAAPVSAAPTTWEIPCCYDPAMGEDLPHLADHLRMPVDKLVSLHHGAEYRIYMYGFAPGFCMLGGQPPELNVSRRLEPRPPAPENLIKTAAGLTEISTFSMPTGWWILGRTPVRMFALARTPQFFAKVGDLVRFRPIGRDEFAALDARAAAGEIIARKIPAREITA
ncbi:5-oxoprolinase subunit B family protein [Roseixanthobacter pseudopolyaromaticivorans]|uniref:5-oxoprolinase subunit B family protein n=1 Tax=Xanthobacteraceae TaxID=335928 RepID=UPI0037290D14